jgi:hypothetical protein
MCSEFWMGFVLIRCKKNAFLHDDLKENVYMKIAPDFGNEQLMDKVCHLKLSLYGLK